MPTITLVEGVTQALAYEMAADDRVICLGEDIGKNGGVFRATDELQAKFGKKRVFDSPLAESMIAGMTIGMASYGLRPVAEFQFMGFSYPAFDQIINHASRLRNRTRGRLTCPAVFRAPYGGGIHAPEHHSESTEALYAHIPGLRVVIPATPEKAYGLLLASIRSPDPVMFLEPKRIYRAVKQDVADDGKELPLDRCFISREGRDVTLVSWGASLKETHAAADQLATGGIEAEIIDVATIKPLDMDTILASVEKTGRCAIIHEAPQAGGVGAEIAANLAKDGILFLEAPVLRIAGYDTVMPYYRLEKSYLPTTERIIAQVLGLMEFA